jgi:hypothetical protein
MALLDLKQSDDSETQEAEQSHTMASHFLLSTYGAVTVSYTGHFQETATQSNLDCVGFYSVFMDPRHGFCADASSGLAEGN